MTTTHNLLNLWRGWPWAGCKGARPVAGEKLLELDAKLFCSDRFFLVCHRTHPLARRRWLWVADLNGCELVHPSRSQQQRAPASGGQAGATALPARGFEVEHLATVAGPIAAGLGVSLVPDLPLFQFRHPDLVAIPLDATELVRPILIVTGRGRSLSVAARAMHERIEAQAASSGVSAVPAERGKSLR